VTSEQEAIKQANIVGYPIVLKPIDGHGGKGVMTHITQEIAVRQAYQATKKLTPTVLLEKHIHGKDGLPFASCAQLFAQQDKLEQNLLVKHTLLKACQGHYTLIPPYDMAKSV
jgi:biotin carboxylase